MFIKELFIGSFRSLEDMKISFRSPNHNYFHNLKLSILVGENGTGKSSILQLLTHIFCPTDRKINEVDDINFSIKFNIDGNDSYYDNHMTYPDEYPNKLIVSSFSVFDPYKVNKFQNKFMSIVKMVEETKYVYCGPLEGNFSSLDTVVKPIIKALFINKSDTNKVNGYLKLLDKVGCIEPIFLEINIRKLRTTNARAFDERFDSEARELVEEYCRIIEELPRIASRNKRNKADHILIEVSHFGIQLLSLYERMVELEIDSCIKDIWFLNRQGQGVPLSRMSSGEVTLLYRFLPLVLEMEDNSIVLIDEPETHLHPKWIQEFIKYLVELFQDYNSHFFIATHSPIIASDVPMECLIGLKKESGRIVPYFPLDRTLGGYSNDLLRDVFNLHEQFGRFSSEEIQLIRTLLESKNEENIKIAKRIYDDLSTTYEKYQLYETYRDLLRDNNVEN